MIKKRNNDLSQKDNSKKIKVTENPMAGSIKFLTIEERIQKLEDSTKEVDAMIKEMKDKMLQPGTQTCLFLSNVPPELTEQQTAVTAGPHSLSSPLQFTPINPQDILAEYWEEVIPFVDYEIKVGEPSQVMFKPSI